MEWSRKDKEEMPQWIKEYIFLDDNEQNEIIRKAKEELEIQQKRIELANKKLEDNNRLKSILYNNGDNLVEVVFEILEKLFKCDLSKFVDEKKEDFLIEKEDQVFIGEIKGVVTNVKNEYISQLEVHYQTYIDGLAEGQSTENIHALLIINDQRNKRVEERESIHEQQISLAKRNGSLIIETWVLLKMFELYSQGKLSSEKCIRIIAENTGLLTVEKLEA